ncbi:GerMN domain-containing protein [Fictibacillus barbaricus]|uniref:Germination protein M n=1 Tax=Fictibacillus barbaricus TaxID=182136 RepID=A0ABU1U2K0_9BACL|nr:GerMN domain-containing protein [Fictibacillus barbaricus]MDR7073695.1 germination protein M [Fictibacillus barbaricus]
MRKTLRTGAPLLLLSVSLLVSGCGLGGSKTGSELDPPKVNYVKEGKSLDKKDKTAAKSAQTQRRQLFLFDSNGMVVPQVLALPKNDETAKQVLEYLVKDGPVSNMIPNGFQAVLPADTEVLSVNINKGTATANFSKEFTEYKPQDELKILQAITFTLTQFDNIKKVKIQIDGKNQNSMPVNNTPIGEGVSRVDGINIENGNVADITNSNLVTLYFLAQTNDQTYYVPVTRRVAREGTDKVTATVENLIVGPSAQSKLLTDFRTDVKLLSTPVVNKDGVATLNFNSALLDNKEENRIADEVLNSIVLSLTELPEVKKVAIQVNGKSKIFNEKGKELTAPVSRPKEVNTGEF